MPLSLRAALLLAAGVAAGLRGDPSLARLCAALMAAALAAAALAWAQQLRWLPGALLALAVFAGAALHGLAAVARAEQTPLRAWFDRRGGPAGQESASERVEELVRLRGRLTRDAALTDGGASVHVAVSHVHTGQGWEAAGGGVALSIGGTLAGEAVDQWRAGRVVQLPAQLRRAARYLNHGEPDAERAMARRGTALVGSVKSASLVEVLAPGRWWDERAADVRAAVRSAMTRRVAPHDPVSAAIGTAILIGDRAQMSPALERRLQEAGTYHVVAISGGNIALLAAAVVMVLWAARVRFGGAAVSAAVILSIHAWVIGGGASVVRATLMAVIYLALRAIDQRTGPANAVAVGAAIMLLVNPLEIGNAGFWLTFGASGALLAVGARWQPPAPARWWYPAAAICVGSLAVELVLMPVSALIFQRVTIAGLVLNLGAVPAMAIVQASASLCVLSEALHAETVARASGWMAHWAAVALVESSRLVDLAPWATWRVPSPPLWLVLVYEVVLAAWWWVSAPGVDTPRRRWTLGVCGGTAITLWMWMAVDPATLARSAPGRLHVTTMDVGQGEAILVSFPNGRTLLVDAGGLSSRGDFDIGDRVLGPALRGRGIRRLDYLAITHGDRDHIGGSAAVVRDFGPREVWAGVPVPAHEPEQALRAEARAQARTWRWLQRGDRMELGEVEVRVHHPPLPDWERQRVRNDDSLVLELRYGEVSVLLTGDISRAVEHELAPALDPLPVVVLKAPHHGSSTSSSQALVSRLRPAVALVSAGRGNLFGHPTKAVIERYAAADAVVFRTDRDGQIELTTDGVAVEVTTFTGRRWRR